MIEQKKEYTIYGYIKEILAKIDSPIIFEFGVHWAEDTNRIMQLCKSTPLYYGFEPDSRNIDKINSIKDNLPYKLNLIHGAISSIEGHAVLFRSTGEHPKNKNPMTGASSILFPKEVTKKFTWFDFKEREVVDSYNLDYFCKDNNISHIDFIWADIQGNEYNMIIGGKKMLKKTKFLYMEYSDRELYEGQKPLKEILKLLPEWGVVHDFKTDILLQNKK